MHCPSVSHTLSMSLDREVALLDASSRFHITQGLLFASKDTHKSIAKYIGFLLVCISRPKKWHSLILVEKVVIPM